MEYTCVRAKLFIGCASYAFDFTYVENRCSVNLRYLTESLYFQLTKILVVDWDTTEQTFKTFILAVSRL